MTGRSAASRTQKFSPVFIALLFLLAALALSSCGGSPKPLVVPDSGNNRVLIYTEPLYTGQKAVIVLGQPDFVTATAGTSATAMTQPGTFAFDSDGNLYVSESVTSGIGFPPVVTGNARVLQFKRPFFTNMSANAVIGATDLNTAGTTFYPTGVALDVANNLWVADANTGRVLEFAAPIICAPSCPTTPTLAVGSGILSTSPSTSIGIAFDSSGNLWVADSGNNRVVEFAKPLSAASAVALQLGDQTGTISSTELLGPTAVAFDDAGNLWVADTSNNRVLKFVPPFSNAMAASTVIGQVGFGSGAANQGGAAAANTLNSPRSVSFFDGNLVVGDNLNNRTLIFSPRFTTNMNASAVLGQANFANNGANQGGIGASTQSDPFDAGFSLLALAVFILLAGAWFAWSRRKRVNA